MMSPYVWHGKVLAGDKARLSAYRLGDGWLA
jgi:hypothetical protein